MLLQRIRGARCRVLPERLRRYGGLLLVVLLCLGLLVAGAASAFAGVSRRAETVLRFGFDLRTTPQEDAKQYLPFLNYLKRETGYTFELRFTPAGSSIVDQLGQGKVHFAAIGADSYLQARTRYGVVPLVRGLNASGRGEYQAVIVVAPHSPIRKIEELRGKRFAFGNKISTQGHLIPRIILAEHGIGLENLAGYEYTGSHLNSANAVAAGRFDAGGMQDTLGRELADAGLLRIIHTSRNYPSSGIAANKDVPPAVLARVRRAFLDFQPRGRDAADLYHWDRTEMPNGFMPARDEDYAELRKWVERLGYYSGQSQQ
jgi:phosphonate transport system substrate-binding protein